MTSYFLHIGMHKTGSTSIQDYLAAQRSALLEAGIDYPMIGRRSPAKSTHAQFAAYFGNNSLRYPANFSETIAGGFTAAPVCILSSEIFYNYSNADAMVRARHVLGDDVQVICYVRDPVSHIRSHYKQALKHQQKIGFATFVARNTRLLRNPDKTSFYCYDENLAVWRNSFELTEAAYDRNNRIEDFLQHCGLDGRFMPPPDTMMVTKNEAFSDTAAVLHQRLNLCLFEKRIEEDRYKSLKHMLFAAKDADVIGLAKDTLQMAELDMRDYKTAFAERNPGHAGCLDDTPDSLSFANGTALTDEEILALIEALAVEPNS